MKTNKLIVVTEDYATTVTLAKTVDYTEKQFITALQITDRFKDAKILTVADAKENHICPYCGNVAKGLDEDRLCEECRDIFGHSFFSEL